MSFDAGGWPWSGSTLPTLPRCGYFAGLSKSEIDHHLTETRCRDDIPVDRARPAVRLSLLRARVSQSRSLRHRTGQRQLDRGSRAIAPRSKFCGTEARRQVVQADPFTVPPGIGHRTEQL